MDVAPFTPRSPAQRDDDRHTLAILVLILVAAPITLVLGGLVVVGVTNWLDESARGSATPSGRRVAAAKSVSLAPVGARPASWDAPADARAVQTTEVDLPTLGLVVTREGSTTEEDESGRLVARDATGAVRWRSPRHRLGVHGIWSDGERIYSFWRGLDDTNVLLDEPAVTTVDQLVVHDARTGKELWWVPAYDSTGLDRWSLGPGDSTPDVRLLLHDDTAVLAVASRSGESYVLSVDVVGRRARWQAPLPDDDLLEVTLAGDDVRVRVGSLYATLDVTTGAPRPVSAS